MYRKAFTLIELLVVIAIIAILAAILFPVFTQAKESAKMTQGVSNVKQAALAVMMYAGDNEDKAPRHDNNGSCAYLETPCTWPDWGDLRAPGGNIANVKQGELVMFFGAISPYHKNSEFSVDPKMGKTNWSAAQASAAQNNIRFQTPYSPQLDVMYNYSLTQMAINMLVVDYGAAGSINGRPGAVKGNLGVIARPAETILFSGSSLWGWGSEVGQRLGNGATWPSNPSLGAVCWSNLDEGWTTYPYRGALSTYSGTHSPNGPRDNPNLKGFAVFAFTDGHVKAMKYAQAERCDPVPNGARWSTSATINRTHYYPFWTPEL
jgi:prepilin-type N-terminal cleavage/methylation domain-containing protein